jgi:hypothetical protein
MTHMLKARRLWSVLYKDSLVEQEAYNAHVALACNIGDDLLHLIPEDKTLKKIWDELKKQFL